MPKFKRSIYALLFLVLTLRTNSAMATPENKLPNCTIKVITRGVNDEMKEYRILTHLNSRKECLALAQMHKPVFNPTQVSQKRVTFRFGPVPQKELTFIYQKNLERRSRIVRKIKFNTRQRSRWR